jgi:hypothetical protein
MFVHSYEEALSRVLAWAQSFNRDATLVPETPLMSITVRVGDKVRPALTEITLAVGLFHAHCQLGHQLEIEERYEAEEGLPPTHAIVTLSDLARYYVAADAVYAAALSRQS